MTADRKPGYVAATQAAQRDLQKRIRTVVPGTVVLYEPATRRATIQPAPSLITNGREARPLPPLPLVPVMFPGGGGFEIVWPLAPGDRVTLLVFDRSIDRWLRGEPSYKPNSGRMHNLSDVMAIPDAVAAEPSPGEVADFTISTAAGEVFRASPLGAVDIASGLTSAAAAREGDAVSIGPDMSTWMSAVATFINAAAPGTVPGIPASAGLIAAGSTRVTIG